MKNYDFKGIESKWQKVWEAERLFDSHIDRKKPKFYALIEFPYPSGAGLHVGHPRPFTAMDIIARKRRMQGYNVLYPIGFDSFGLPTENYAIKTGIRPEDATHDNIASFTKQLKSLGFSFDWNARVITSDPDYYKWTQWMFIQFFNAGLAYKGTTDIWWCPTCKIGIANEELESGRCERCGSDVVKKTKPIWCFKMQSYSDKLLDGLSRVDYPDNVKKMQEDWIGRSVGAKLTFKIGAEPLEVFTTRADTIFGVTYMVLAPEHPLVDKLKPQIGNWSDVQKYRDEVLLKTDVERAQDTREKTGVRLDGIMAENPLTHEFVPVFISDYVLMNYGTGAIMAVPAHDERDLEFARKFGLPVKRVIDDNGLCMNSDFLNGLARVKAVEAVLERTGERSVNYRMTDWQFSRQRYWGEPIPMVYCEKCGWVPLPESELPLVLPPVEDYFPTDDGMSPLKRLKDWVHTTCPKCGGKAERETDTMPTWAGSCWYFLRYMDPHNPDAFASKEALDYWGQVDWYEGGQEHVTRHLLYSRFWHKALYDLGLVPYDEPYAKRSLHGMILAENGVKMSKSKGNVVNPNDIVEKYGADTLRVYEMFIGPFDQAASWSTTSLIGVHRFLSRIYARVDKVKDEKMDKEDRAVIAAAIRDVSERVEQMKFNTAVSALMIALNYMESKPYTPREMMMEYTKLLSPFAPHLADELWEMMGGEGRLAFAGWPTFNPADIADDNVVYVVQVNGKKRFEMSAPAGLAAREVETMALDDILLAPYIEDKEVKRIVVVQDKIVNIVV
ncbi:MAG: leucine--tRNA ligase [Rickettsiales bacterium]|jgi:leucyl-tRNA synthetase|nr:leucine--tRNA ligase [Rickettsiales bacterium]